MSMPSESFAHLDDVFAASISTEMHTATHSAASRHLLGVAALPKAAKRSLFLSEPIQLIAGSLRLGHLRRESHVQQERECGECRNPPTNYHSWWFEPIAINITAESIWFIILAHASLENAKM